MDVHEIIRLARMGRARKEIGRLVNASQPTVRKYLAWAETEGLLEGPLPEPAALEQRLAGRFPEVTPTQQQSGLTHYTTEIVALREQKVEMAAIRLRLQERHGEVVSYEALRRHVRRLEGAKIPEAFVPVEVPAGAEAQVDFGYAGLTLDETGRARRTWVFVMVLSFSRHLFACLVYNQCVATWLECHRRAFDYFGGVPERVVPDNLKAAIVKASFTAPEPNRAYRECASHYDFLIDPQPPRQPHLKGKVESGVHYVKRNFLAGRDLQSREALDAALRQWCTAEAGQRVHGTTRQAPLARFAAAERAALRSLPRDPFEPASWRRAKVHRDCHVVHDGAFYSVPYRLVGQEVLLRGGTRTVRVYDHEQLLVACHDRHDAGERATVQSHLPPHKVAALDNDRSRLRERAEAVGPATAAIAAELLDSAPMDRRRQVARLLELETQHGASALEQACVRARGEGVAEVGTVRALLLAQTSGRRPPERARLSRVLTFARDASDFALAALVGGRP
ncbi:MAG: IS21 family transposase [Anaerolineae bacterium]